MISRMVSVKSLQPFQFFLPQTIFKLVSSHPIIFVLIGYCAYLDVENGMNPSLAEAIGVNVENLLISQPDSAENLLSIVDTLTKSGSVDVIVVDSVSASLYNSRLIYLLQFSQYMSTIPFFILVFSIIYPTCYFILLIP